MEDYRKLVLVDHLVDRISHPISGMGVLQNPVKFETFHTVAFDQVARLARTIFAFVRIDTGEGHADIVVLGGDFGDLVVRNPFRPQSTLAINREHAEGYV